MVKTDERVIRFFVSGVLLASSAACTKNKSDTKNRANTGGNEEHVNEGEKVVNKKPEEHVNEGPVGEKAVNKKPDDLDLGFEETVNEGPMELPASAQVDASVPSPAAKEPDRVNTNHIGPNGVDLQNPHGIQPRPSSLPLPVDKDKP